jgi:hypothetical protein
MPLLLHELTAVAAAVAAAAAVLPTVPLLITMHMMDVSSDTTECVAADDRPWQHPLLVSTSLGLSQQLLLQLPLLVTR